MQLEASLVRRASREASSKLARKFASVGLFEGLLSVCFRVPFFVSDISMMVPGCSSNWPFFSASWG